MVWGYEVTYFSPKFGITAEFLRRFPRKRTMDGQTKQLGCAVARSRAKTDIQNQLKMVRVRPFVCFFLSCLEISQKMHSIGPNIDVVKKVQLGR